MGLFGKLFGPKPKRVPSWATGFAGRPALFDDFVECVIDVLADKGLVVGATEVRSGSVQAELAGHPVEWYAHDAAEGCAVEPPEAWAAIIARSFDGPADSAAPAPPGRTGSQKAWAIGTAEWGGVMLEAGSTAMALILLPVEDGAVFDRLPVLPAGLVRDIIVCNASSHGVLRTSAVARVAGVTRVYALDPAAPVDRGAPTDVAIAALPRELTVGAIQLAHRDGAIVGTWNDGVSVVVGDAVRFSTIAEVAPNHVVGKAVPDGFESSKFLAALATLRQAVIMANVPGVDATALATTLSNMGVGCQVVNARTRPRLQVLASMLAGELEAADERAIQAIAAGDDVDDMHYQRAIIALMRGDEPAALAALEQAPALPQAINSRAIIHARRGDPAARGLATQTLALLPEDVLAIRTATMVHVLLGDLDGARGVLASHGRHLPDELRAALERAFDEPVQRGPHRFPEHAALALDAITPLIEAGRFAEAEPLLRRAAGWDPESYKIPTELGFVLSRLGRDDEAIAIYDAAIAGGGAAVLLRFNRGNCKLRGARHAEAIADFRACVELEANWHDARVNLISALFAAGHQAEARAELEQLRQRGGNAAHVMAVEQLLDGTG